MPRLTLAGGFAKLTKLAQGHLDLHSARSAAGPAGARGGSRRGMGAPAALVAAMADGQHRQPDADAGTRTAAFPLADLVAAEARRWRARWPGTEVALEVLVVDREGSVVGQAAGW